MTDRPGRTAPAISLAFVLLILGGLVLLATDGHFLFTLDDPYIHLALADRIAHGGYGINPGEPASPASSIVYPVLLAPFAAVGLGAWGALGLNVAATFAIFFSWDELFHEIGWRGARGWGALLATLAVNGVALPFTGMEHTLHVACCVFALRGVVALAEDRAPPGLLVPVALLGAGLRYEGGAVAMLVAALLVWRRRRAGLVLAGAVLSLYAAFSGMLLALGLPALPSSILAKSDMAASGARRDGVPGMILSLSEQLWDNATAVHGAMAVALGFAAFVLVLRRDQDGARARLVVLAAAVALFALHLVAFKSGWFYRYEPYAVVFVLGAVAYALAGDPALGATSAVWLTAFALAYAFPVAETPIAARNVYEQQYQLRRFAQAVWKEPVAVNDLGLVAWQNPAYVLDLRGLGLDAARRAFERRDTAWVDDERRRRGVRVAIIYREWFAGWLPADAVEVARMHLGSRKITPWGEAVSFYALDPGAEQDLRAALGRFAADLPADVVLEAR